VVVVVVVVKVEQSRPIKVLCYEWMTLNPLLSIAIHDDDDDDDDDDGDDDDAM